MKQSVIVARKIPDIFLLYSSNIDSFTFSFFFSCLQLNNLLLSERLQNKSACLMLQFFTHVVTYSWTCMDPESHISWCICNVMKCIKGVCFNLWKADHNILPCIVLSNNSHLQITPSFTSAVRILCSYICALHNVQSLHPNLFWISEQPSHPIWPSSNPESKYYGSLHTKLLIQYVT